MQLWDYRAKRRRSFSEQFLTEQPVDHIAIGDGSWPWETGKIGAVVIDSQCVIDRSGEVFGTTGPGPWSRPLAIGRADNRAALNSGSGQQCVAC